MHRIEIRTDFSNETFGLALRFQYHRFMLVPLLKKLAQKILQSQCYYDDLPYAFELSILITGEAQMRSLNHKYRHQDKSTDVLSFPSFLIPSKIRCGGTSPQKQKTIRKIIQKSFAAPLAVIPLGDVVISYHDCLWHMKNLPQHGYVALPSKLNELFALLLIHGVLHLFGYDHETNAMQRRSMRQREAELFSQII